MKLIAKVVVTLAVSTHVHNIAVWPAMKIHVEVYVKDFAKGHVRGVAYSIVQEDVMRLAMALVHLQVLRQ